MKKQRNQFIYTSKKNDIKPIFPNDFWSKLDNFEIGKLV